MGGRLGLSLLLLGCAAFGACGGDSTAADQSAAAPRDPASDLVGRFLTRTPAGFVLQPDVQGETGAFDIEQAVAESDDAAADRAALTKSGFVAGHTRAWRRDVSETDFSEVVVVLSAHATDDGARAYIEHLVRSVGGANTSAAECEVESIPGASCQLNFTKAGEGGGIFFTRGRYVAAVLMHGDDASVANLSALAKQQYDRLG